MALPENRQKLFAFRFDVDTPVCLREGVPRLLDLAAATGVKFTFFVNPGRAISRREVVREALVGNASKEAKLTLGAVHKFGLPAIAEMLLWNPLVARRQHAVIQRCIAEGHEVGLHGGYNHALWARQAHLWDERKLSAEVEFGIGELKRAGIASLQGFSSPGWRSNSMLKQVLSSKGFRYMADLHGVGAVEHSAFHKLPNLITEFTGEPGGVGYFEYQVARNKVGSEATAEFESKLEAVTDYAILYDHPGYAGRHCLDRLSELIEVVRRRGFKVATMAEIAQRI